MSNNFGWIVSLFNSNVTSAAYKARDDKHEPILNGGSLIVSINVSQSISLDFEWSLITVRCVSRSSNSLIENGLLAKQGQKILWIYNFTGRILCKSNKYRISILIPFASVSGNLSNSLTVVFISILSKRKIFAWK